MEDKKPSRLVGSKVSQIANIFQSMVPAKETEVLLNNAAPQRNNQSKTSECSPKMERRRIAVGEDAPRDSRDSPTQVTVVRTESHVARFNNARALFEKLGAEDTRGTKSEKAASQPLPPGSRLQATPQHGLRSRSSSDNSSAGTSPVRSPRALGSRHSSRSPSPKEISHSDNLSSPAGGMHGLSIDNGVDGQKLHATNGPQTNGRPDLLEEVMVSNITTPLSATERLFQKNAPHVGKVTENNNQANGVIKREKDFADKEDRLIRPTSGLSGLLKKPDKPEKPERKFNSRELIEKQRNWTSHFSKSRTSRYNSEPNKSEVKASLSASAMKTEGLPVQSIPVDKSPPAASAATRSASFNTTRSPRSPPVSPPPPPSISPSRSPVTPTQAEEKQEKESQEKNAEPVSPARSTSSSSSRSSKVGEFCKETIEDGSKISELPSPGRGSDSSSNITDSEKRLREEEAGEVRHDVAHVDKRKKMVSSVQLTLQAAGLGPTSPVAVSSAPGTPEDTSPAPITNSVLLELESQGSGDVPGLPGAHYTEITNSECRDIVEDSKQLKKQHDFDDRQFIGRFGGSTSSLEKSENESLITPKSDDSDKFVKTSLLPVNNYKEGLDSGFKEEQVSDSDSEVSPRTVLQSPSDPSQISLDITKTSVDVIGGSGYVPSKSDKTNETLDLFPDPLHDTILSPDKAFADKSPTTDSTEPSPMSGSAPLPDVLDTSSCGIVQGILTGASSEGSILDLQDVEYADADAEDGDDEAEHEEEKHLLLQNGGDVHDSPTLLEQVKSDLGIEFDKLSDKKVELPETMTPDEAENLLSTRILEKKIRQEGLLSDEEAQEVTRLLSPSDEKDRDDPEWLADVLSVTSDSQLQDSTLDYRSRSETSMTMEDSMTSSHIGSHSGSESGLLGSVSSLNDQDGAGDQESRIEDYIPIPGRVVIIENGVHYFEDGHFWMEVPGLPESEEDDDSDYPIPVKKTSKVTFSTGPIKVYSTFSVNDYDRRNEDVDPVAASAEYELEKRVEKMEVFPVELTKGPEGLGLSIIGMGVGADAGLEKLGIFVKTITEHGAAARDGRIQVNDQIIEVDGKSLVGVTQAYAASVLRNTCGLVKFLIGREKDPQNSEVAQLIKQSLQADREREEQRRQMEQAAAQRVRGHHHSSDSGPLSPDGNRSEDSSITMPLTGTSPTTSSSSDGPTSPPGATDSVFEADTSKLPAASSDVDSLRLLQELAELEQNGADNEEYLERLQRSPLRIREMERMIITTKKEVSNYQDMLEQSQGQYITLEKKYCKAKKLLREFQQREQDLLHREEFYLQLLQEKDTEYNALVKSLKDRVIQLEQELLETQRKAGLPAVLPYDSTSLRQLTPQLTRRQQAPPVKPLLQQLETELSDTEISDISPEDGDKTATVERKMPVKEELDRAVPPHELLDVSASKAKAELATRGGLAGRQLPSGKKGSGGLSSSSSDYGLDESCDNSGDEDEQDRKHLYIEYVGREENSNEVQPSSVNSYNHQQNNNRPTTLSPSSPSYNNISSITSTSTTSHVHTLVSQFSSVQQQQQQQQQQQHFSSSAHTVTQQTGLIAKSHSHFQSSSSSSSLHSPSGPASATALYSHATHSPGSQPLHVHPHSIHPSQHQPSPDPWTGRPQSKIPAPSYPLGPPRGLTGPPASLAEQLKQVLAERERRISGGEPPSSREGSGDFTELNKGVSRSLAEEIHQAVNEANARVKKVPMNQSLITPLSGVIWQQQNSPMRDIPPPSPSSISSSGSVSPGVPTADPSPSKSVPTDGGDVWTPPHPQDLNSSFSGEKKSSHFWQSAPVTEWSKEQVCQWLLALNLEQHIPKFLELQVGGSALLQLESRDFKQLGVNGEDKNRLKRKLKELKVQVEKEKRQQEKERKEKERLQRKAEKLAEKASRRK
ncbi:uncharacterized protein Spn isoform X2 [Anabrus simplex]|uniref:uncharacterized protein Spn isoform X2 n=1 Tax=Anabrus simplex TaxID=316456 RepID=UPI0035A2A446